MQSTEYQMNNFIEYVRTKQFIVSTHKERSPNEFVFISMTEIKNRFLVNPEHDINQLIQMGEIERKKAKSPKGYDMNLFRVLKAGYYDLNLLHPKGRELDSITTKMMSYLNDVTLRTGSESTHYFDSFLKLKNSNLRIFFTIDHFSGRVHTPITSLKSNIRPNILLDSEETTSIDVVTMQPVLLGAILKNKVGINDFSEWIDSGKDIYIMIQEKLNLSSRNDAKKKFFEILFATANNELSRMFGNANWITWINEFKSKPFEANPHTLEKNHSNLAWLLQRSEVQLMRKVWERLLSHGIKFLSVHDEVIVKTKDHEKALKIIQDVLSKDLTFFKLSNKSTDEVKTSEEPSPEPPKTAEKQRRTIQEILSTIPKGRPFYPYELKEKFNLTDEEIHHHFEECLMDSVWIPFD
jgi:hypothetical protein